MERILFLVPHLDYGGRGKQVSLLLPALSGHGFVAQVCSLGRDGPLGDRLRAAGFAVDVLNKRKWLDFKAWHRLWNILQVNRPDIVHVWGLEALRFLISTIGPTPPRLVVSDPFPPHRPGLRLSWLDRWLLGLAQKIVVSCHCEVETCRRLGLPAGRVALVSPAVEIKEPMVPPPEPGQRWMVGVGPLEPHKGFRDAIWAFDILRYLYDDLHLALIGDGTDLDRLRRFRQTIAAEDRIHLAGRQADAAPWLARADVVLVPSWKQGGINAALEALALGRPVVASHLPALAEIVRDRETGLLFAPEDKGTLARQVRRLLDDSELARRLGENGRELARDSHSVAAMADRYAALYRGNTDE